MVTITVNLDSASDWEDQGLEAWKESVEEREKGGARGAYGAGAFDGARGYGAIGYDKIPQGATGGGGEGNGPSRDDYAAAIRFGQPKNCTFFLLPQLPIRLELMILSSPRAQLMGIIAQMGPMVRLVRVALSGVHLDCTVKVRRTPLPSFGPRHIPRSELSPKLYVSSSYLTSRATPRPASQGVHGNDAEPKLEIAAN